MIQNEEYFKLFANCVTVKGARRSVLYDLQRMRLRFIPNLLHEIITSQKDKTISETKKAYNHQYDEGIDAFFNLLLKEGWGFLTKEPQRFPDLSLTWESPFQITNAIIDIGEESNHDFGVIMSQLNDLGCVALQIRVYSSLSENTLELLLSHTQTSRLKHIGLILKYSRKYTEDHLSGLIARNKRINNIIIHSSPFDVTCKLENSLATLIYSKEEITSCAKCGQIGESTFAINIPLFTESQKHNSCLNRKIAIDIHGNIKNCPSMELSFGNIQQMSLQSALAKKEFKLLWEINKDQIEVCKDCEFRYICTDCRAYIQNPKDIYSKPSKCKYDPYKDNAV